MPAAKKPRRTKKAVIEALEKREGRMYQAATDLMVSGQTLRNYAKRWPEIREIIDDYRETLVDMAERGLREAVKKGNLRAIIFVLQTLGNDRGYSVSGESRAAQEEHPTEQICKTAAAVEFITQLDLPEEMRVAILLAVEESERQQDEQTYEENSDESNVILAIGRQR